MYCSVRTCNCPRVSTSIREDCYAKLHIAMKRGNGKRTARKIVYAKTVVNSFFRCRDYDVRMTAVDSKSKHSYHNSRRVTAVDVAASRYQASF